MKRAALLLLFLVTSLASAQERDVVVTGGWLFASTGNARVRNPGILIRAGKILRDDMEAMGPVRLKDVDEAQMRMVNIAKDLANKGEIMIAGGSAEDELVY